MDEEELLEIADIAVKDFFLRAKQAIKEAEEKEKLESENVD
jgi:hypothetical protein